MFCDDKKFVNKKDGITGTWEIIEWDKKYYLDMQWNTLNTYDYELLNIFEPNNNGGSLNVKGDQEKARF